MYKYVNDGGLNCKGRIIDEKGSEESGRIVRGRVRGIYEKGSGKVEELVGEEYNCVLVG